MKRVASIALLTVLPVLGSAQPAVYPLQDLPQSYPNALTGGNYMYNFYLPPPGTGSPWWPAWSPDGTSLAFSLQGTIWQMRLGEAEAYELVHTREYLSSPAFSPDGRFVVFTADNGHSINLWLLELETEELTRLTDGDFLNLDPAWSPDGGRIAYVSTRPNGYYNIFVTEIAEAKPGRTIQLTRDNSFGRARLYFGEYDLHIQPAWMPDADSLLFVSNRGIPLGSGGVWRMPALENGIDQATLIHKEETLYRTRPHVSLDGKRFVYSSHLGHQYNNLFVLPTVGGEPYKLTFGEWDSFSPSFSPDGESIVYVSNQGGMPNLRLLQTYGGRDQEIAINTLHWKEPPGSLSVRVVDAESNELLPARIYNRAADGKTYVPAGSYHRLGRLAEHFFHTAGSFTLEVPAGEIVVEAMHGFEYHPAAATASVVAGQVTEVTLKLRRMADLEADGWFSGSNHVHMNYGGNLHNTPENLVFMAAAEDVHVIGQLVANKDNRILDYQYFTGAPHPLTDGNHVLYFNQEYRPPFYGHVSFINLTEHLISPYVTGYEGTAIESLYPSNAQMFRLAREQGAMGAYVHPYWGSEDPLETNLGVAKAFPVDLALGVLDYHELVSGANWAAYLVWHHALNNGFKIPAVGGEDSISNLHRTAIIGQMRAYAHMGDSLTWDGWLEAIRTGQLFVTNGPLLELSVNGRGIGSTIDLPVGGGTVAIRGRARSIAPLDSAALVINGRKLDLGDLSRHADPDGAGTQFSFERQLEIGESSWITLQVHTGGIVHPIDDRFLQATTNPIWVTVGDRPIRSAESADYFIRWIDKLAGMAEEHPGWRSAREKEFVLGEFQEARAVYERLLQEAQRSRDGG